MIQALTLIAVSAIGLVQVLGLFILVDLRSRVARLEGRLMPRVFPTAPIAD